MKAKAVPSDLRHQARYWNWKFKRREAECEELADQLRAALAVLSEIEGIAAAPDFATSEMVEEIQGIVENFRMNERASAQGLSEVALEARREREGLIDRLLWLADVDPGYPITRQEIDVFEEAARALGCRDTK